MSRQIRESIDVDWIHQHYYHCEERGVFIWKEREGKKTFNTRYANRVAGFCYSSEKGWQIKYKGKNRAAHLMLAAIKGFSPDDYLIYPLDGDYSNLKWSNFGTLLKSEQREIDVNYLNELLYYNEDEGRLYWKERPYSKCFNSRYANKPFGTVGVRGYYVGSVDNRNYYEHRIIAVMFGILKDISSNFQIDHIDGNPLNNKLENLRAVTHSGNGKNQKMNINNTTGRTGVWVTPSGKYSAEIVSEGVKYKLGTFETLEEASDARLKAEMKHGFHENHGRK